MKVTKTNIKGESLPVEPSELDYPCPDCGAGKTEECRDEELSGLSCDGRKRAFQLGELAVCNPDKNNDVYTVMAMTSCSRHRASKGTPCYKGQGDDPVNAVCNDRIARHIRKMRPSELKGIVRKHNGDRPKPTTVKDILKELEDV